MSRDAPLRIGLIGTGRIGRVHAANLREHPGVVCAWVADPLEDQVRAVAESLGAPFGTDPHELIARGDAEAIIVASPTSTHVELIEAGVRAGAAVLCEKPIDLDDGRARSIAPLVRDSGVPVAIGFNRRFDPSFARVRQRVADGEIGPLEQLTIVSRDPAPPPEAYLRGSGGIFRDMTIHDLDMARFFVPDLTEVTASGSTLFDDGARACGDFDTAVTVLRNRAGQVVTILNSRHSAVGYDQRIEAFGALGSLAVVNPHADLVRASGAHAADAGSPYEPFFLERYASAYRAELDAFVRMARSGDPECPTFEDGLAALALAQAADRSSQSGQSVSIEYAK